MTEENRNKSVNSLPDYPHQPISDTVSDLPVPVTLNVSSSSVCTSTSAVSRYRK